MAKKVLVWAAELTVFLYRYTWKQTSLHVQAYNEHQAAVDHGQKINSEVLIYPSLVLGYINNCFMQVNIYFMKI